MNAPIKKSFASRDNQIQELNDDEIDVELSNPSNLFSTHINLIPLQSAVQGPRLFYGARFYNQALPLVNPEAPLVQNLDDSDPGGASFDEKMGKAVGAIFADDDGEVIDVTPDSISVKYADGTVRNKDIYNNFIFNRKSVTGDSQLLIRRNDIITSVLIAEYNYQQGDEVISYCPETKKSQWQKITGYLKHTNDKKLYTVMYESGRSVTVTEDHSLLTLNSDWNLSPIYPLDCVINETRTPSVFAEVTQTGTQEDFDEGALVGLYLSEGSISKQQHGSIQIAVEPPERVLEARELVRKVRNVTPHSGKVNCTFTDHSLHDFLAENCGCGAGNKYISNLLLNKPRRYLEGIIAGYMGGDGCLWRDGNGAIQVTGVSTSKKLRDDLTVVLNMLGIFTTRFDCPREHINSAWNNAYGFRAISAHLNKLDKWFFYSDREDKFRKALKAKFRASVFEQIPVPEYSCNKLYNSLPGKTPNSVYQAVFHGYISKHRLIEAKGTFGQWASSDILWDKIIDIIPAKHEEFVYDLEVEDSQAFAVNNGLLVHNTGITNKPLIAKGDIVKKGQILARSNYTDDKGTLALGTNARVGLVPYKGFSMDDAIVISDSFAKRLTSDHAYTHEQDFDRDTKGGLNHYVSLFPTAFTKDQIKKMDTTGVIKPGSVVNEGDPLILATRPRVFSSASSQLGKLSKSMRQSRHDSSQKWDSPYPGVVTDVAKTKTGYKVIVKSEAPAQAGDKIVYRSGQKGIIAKILPEEQMPRTKDGKPLEVLLNSLGIPSRVNSSLIYELLLGKAAAAKGSPIKVPGFNKKGEKWYDYVAQVLKESNIPETEEVFDPVSNRLLENPITVGVGHILKLHHVAACFDDKTEVLTQDGWKYWKDVLETDLLASADTRGNKLIFDKPLHLLKYKYDGLLCAYKGRYVDYAVTPNHNMWCKYYYGTRIFGLVPASQLHGKRFKLKQFGFEVVSPTSEEYFELGGRSFVWDDFCEFVGWWVTEGCVGSNNSQVLIYQSSTANLPKCERIEKLLNRMGVKWSHYKSGGVINGFAINEKSFAEYFSNYGSHSQFKRVPRELITGCVSGCKRMIEAILLGDGSITLDKSNRIDDDGIQRGPLWRLTSTSKQLVDDFQELCIRVGYGSNINKIPRDWKKFAENPHYLDAWQASYTETRDLVQVDGDRNKEAFSLVPYNGFVYCAEMPTGLVYVRRNGKPMLSGNSKVSSRGQGSYDNNQQPLKGGSESAQSKRLSGLEIGSLLSSGAYKTIKEGSTLRGQQNDNYWRALRQGYKPQAPGAPFVWEKFKALLTGAGLHARSLPKGELRLGPFTDDELDRRDAVEIQSGELVDLNSMESIPGGLFDQAIVGNNKWGKISLPFKVPNPAMESSIRNLLGLTEKELRGILAGQMPLPEHLR